MKKRKNEKFENNEGQNQGGIRDNAAVFAKKIGDFFSTEPQKEKVLSHEDFSAAGDVYYAGVSAYYKVAERILLVLLVLFIVFSIITNSSEITYNNFYYLLKDFTSAADAGNNTYETLSYESDSRQRFVLYRGGIAAVSPSRLSIFTATGRRTLNETSSFSSPYAVSSNRYVLFYDTAGKSFSIYNSFSKVYSEELPNPVKCAALGTDGSFAIVTKAESGYWTTRIYTRSFDLKAIIPTSEYIFGLSLDSDGQKLAVLTYNEGIGIGRTKASIYDLSKMKDSKGNKITLIKTLEYDGEFPIKCGFIDSGAFAMITDSRIRFFDKKLEETDSSDDYSDGSLRGYYLGDEGVAVAVIRNAGSAVYVFNGSGNALMSDEFSQHISDISVYDQYLFLQTEQGVMRVDCRNNTVETLNAGNGKMLVYNGKTALVCGESKAEYLVFS